MLCTSMLSGSSNKPAGVKADLTVLPAYGDSYVGMPRTLLSSSGSLQVRVGVACICEGRACTGEFVIEDGDNDMLGGEGSRSKASARLLIPYLGWSARVVLATWRLGDDSRSGLSRLSNSLGDPCGKLRAVALFAPSALSLSPFKGGGDHALGATSIARLDAKSDTEACGIEARRCDNDCIGNLFLFTLSSPAVLPVPENELAASLVLLPPRGGGMLPLGIPLVISRGSADGGALREKMLRSSDSCGGRRRVSSEADIDTGDSVSFPNGTFSADDRNPCGSVNDGCCLVDTPLLAMPVASLLYIADGAVLMLTGDLNVGLWLALPLDAFFVLMLIL